MGCGSDESRSMLTGLGIGPAAAAGQNPWREGTLLLKVRGGARRRVDQSSALELAERRGRVVVEEVLDHPTSRSFTNGTSTCARETRLTETRTPGSAPPAHPVAARGRREQLERRREHRPRPLLGPAEEAPGPLPRLDPRRGELAELGDELLDPRGHQVQVRRRVLQAERRPVEVIVRHERRVLFAAAAGELDAKDGRVVCTRAVARAGGSRERRTCVSRASGTRTCRRLSACRTWEWSTPCIGRRHPAR